MRHAVVFETVIVLWVATEIAFGIGKRARPREARDRGSLMLLWAAITAAMVAAAFAASIRATLMPLAVPLFWTGIALIVAGIAIRVVAIRTLGRYFTVHVAIQEKHQIVERGMYRVIRHPSYLGSLVSFFGVGLAMRNWLSLAIAFLVPLIGFSYRMAVEERALIEHFGDRYREYMKRTKRLIPFVY